MNDELAKTEGKWLDRLLSRFLTVGVAIAAVVVLSGGLNYLASHGGSPQGLHVFRGEPQDLRHLDGIIRDAMSLNSRGIIQLGLLFLMATPVAWVTILFVAFLIERDWLYTIFALVVMLILLYSLVGRQFI